MENKLSHFDENGNAVMVDVSDKPVTHRTAVATGSIQVGAEIMERLTEGTVMFWGLPELQELCL